MNIWVIYVTNSVFEVPEKSNPIFPKIRCQINFLNIYLYSKFNAEFKYFYRIQFPIFFYEIFKFWSAMSKKPIYSMS